MCHLIYDVRKGATEGVHPTNIKRETVGSISRLGAIVTYTECILMGGVTLRLWDEESVGL